MIYRVATFLEIEAHEEDTVFLCYGFNLLAASGEPVCAGRRTRDIPSDAPKYPAPDRAKRTRVELAGIGADRYESGGQGGTGARTGCVTEKDYAGLAGKCFVRHLYPVLIDRLKRTADRRTIEMLFRWPG
jgi:hypothetical protein